LDWVSVTLAIMVGTTGTTAIMVATMVMVEFT